MLPIHDARSKLIGAGYEVPLQPIYKELTIINAKYSDVKKFLIDSGYDGNIVVIGKKNEQKTKAEKPDKPEEYEQMSLF